MGVHYRVQDVIIGIKLREKVRDLTRSYDKIVTA